MCSQAAHTGHFEVCAKGPSENITVQQTLQTAAWFWHMLDTDTSQKKKQSTMKPHKRYHKQTNIKISNIGET